MILGGEKNLIQISLKILAYLLPCPTLIGASLLIEKVVSLQALSYRQTCVYFFLYLYLYKHTMYVHLLLILFSLLLYFFTFRCIVMVGLPFPNKNSPELKEKITYLNRCIGVSSFYQNSYFCSL